MNQNEDQIIYCDGIYEVHPSDDSWAVVNSKTGNTYTTYADREEAICHASELNDGPETCGSCSGSGFSAIHGNRPDDFGSHYRCDLCDGTGRAIR